MKKKTKIVLTSYALAALTALGGWAAAKDAGLRYHRADAQQAFIHQYAHRQHQNQRKRQQPVQSFTLCTFHHALYFPFVF